MLVIRSARNSRSGPYPSEGPYWRAALPLRLSSTHSNARPVLVDRKQLGGGQAAGQRDDLRAGP